MDDHHEGPTCICGQQVAVPHKECMALLTQEERRRWSRGGSYRSRGVHHPNPMYD